MLKALRWRTKSAARTAFKYQDRALARLSLVSYPTARACYHYQMGRHIYLSKKRPILVHQMGKVGSSTVVASLKRVGPKRPIYHTHYFSPDRIAGIERRRKHYYNSPQFGRLHHIWQSQYLYKQIKNDSSTEKWPIITLTRDPIAFNISNFFSHIDVDNIANDGSVAISSAEYSFDTSIDEDISPLIELFFERFNHDLPLEYFDIEFEGILGIDLYEEPFPTAKGYQIYRGELADVLLIRLENLNNCAQEAFTEFLGIEDLALVRRNIRSSEKDAGLYRRFKDAIVFPQSYIDKMYASEFCQTFYDDSEIEHFRRKWQTPEQYLCPSLEPK